MRIRSLTLAVAALLAAAGASAQEPPLRIGLWELTDEPTDPLGRPQIWGYSQRTSTSALQLGELIVLCGGSSTTRYPRRAPYGPKDIAVIHHSSPPSRKLASASVDSNAILVDREEHPVGYHQLGVELMAMEKPFIAGGARCDLQLVDRGVDPA